jgi:hypothetical protein
VGLHRGQLALQLLVLGVQLGVMGDRSGKLAPPALAHPDPDEHRDTKTAEGQRDANPMRNTHR